MSRNLLAISAGHTARHVRAFRWVNGSAMFAGQLKSFAIFSSVRGYLRAVSVDGLSRRQAHRGLCYAASTQELAVLEALAHFEKPAQQHWLIRLTLRDASVTRLRDLPDGWRHKKRVPRDVGEAWLATGQSHALLVPSALGEGGCNVLIASQRLAARQLHLPGLRPFVFDPRLLAGARSK